MPHGDLPLSALAIQQAAKKADGGYGSFDPEDRLVAATAIRHIDRIEASLAEVAGAVVDMQEDVTGMKVAMFGNPLDHEDNGIAGSIREIREYVTTKAHARSERFYHMLIGTMGSGLIGLIVAVASGVH